MKIFILSDILDFFESLYRDGWLFYVVIGLAVVVLYLIFFTR